MRRWVLALALAACGPAAEPIVAPTATAPTTSAPIPVVVAPKEIGMTEETLMRHVAFLTSAELAGRRAYTADERAAATYLVAQLEAAGVPPHGAQRLHAFQVGDQHSANVLGAIRCSECADPDEHVVLGAHYDHMGQMEDGMYLGAEDNASGVAVVIEIARALVAQKQRLGRSVLIVFFGAEEMGLKGSRAFVADEALRGAARWSAMVNIDMIGRRLADRAIFAIPKRIAGIDEQNSVGVLGMKGRPEFRALVDRACASAEISAIAPEDLGGVLSNIVERISKGRGDSYSFEDVGVPALFFSSGESDDYHRPSDTADRIEPAIMLRRANAILEVTVALSKLEVMPR